MTVSFPPQDILSTCAGMSLASYQLPRGVASASVPPLAAPKLSTAQYWPKQDNHRRPQSEQSVPRIMSNINNYHHSDGLTHVSTTDREDPGYTFSVQHGNNFENVLWSQCQPYGSTQTSAVDPRQPRLSLSAEYNVQTSWNGMSEFFNQGPSNAQYLADSYPESEINNLSYPPQSRNPLSNMPAVEHDSASLSPLYMSSCSSTPTTPASSTLPFTPSPTMSDRKNMLGPDLAQASSVNSNKHLLTPREQCQLFKAAITLPIDGAGPYIPQMMYKPHTASDKKRYVEEVMFEAPIYFTVEHPSACGISLYDALHSRVKNLINRDQTVFEDRGPSVSIRLEWPGYRQWSRQIPTKDFRSPPGPITVAKLAKNVAKCVDRFIADRKGHSMEEESDPIWRIGDGINDIKLDDLILVSIHQVSLGSWQPHLRLRRPLRNRQLAARQTQAPRVPQVPATNGLPFHQLP